MQSFNIKSCILGLAVVCSYSKVTAQQLYKISQYIDRSFIHNPAAVGANGVTTAGAAYRSQWSGIDGGPKTAVLFADTYFGSKSTGAGIVLYNDETGPTSRSGADLSVSYSIKLNGDDKRLMFGLGGQVLQFKVDKAKIASSIPGDPILSSDGSSIKGDANAGIFYRSKTFNAGFAARQLVQPKLDFVKTATNTEGRLYRHYIFNASYSWATDESNVVLPHVEMRFAQNAPVDVEGGVVLIHKDLLQLGVSAHYKQAYTIFAGIKLQHKFSINYAYDVYNNPVSVFESGFAAHEIMLRYFFSK
jgi:type IX secretion system PorP/SprF family membrane protein